jgi:hypothetical protein
MFEPLWPNIRLQVDVVGAQPRHQLKRRFQVIDICRVALRLPNHSMLAQKAGDVSATTCVLRAHRKRHTPKHSKEVTRNFNSTIGKHW